MMNTAFRRETVNAVYLALQANKLADLLKLVHEIPIQGLSVTMPLKQEIMAHLEKTDPLSAKIGACNTVLRAQDGKLYGFNTDVAGITGPLEKRMSLRGAKVLVLGAGGAARAAVFGLRDKGAEVFILNRTPETAQKLASQSGSKTIKKDAVAKTTFDVIINATPIGMAGNKARSCLKRKISTPSWSSIWSTTRWAPHHGLDPAVDRGHHQDAAAGVAVPQIPICAASTSGRVLAYAIAWR